MEIDFDKLIGDDESLPTNPRDIFLTLDKSPEFSFLRDIQADVLDSWYEDPDRRDAVIKLNVGSGKTLVGLLVLKSSLNACVGPAVFICPDNFLVEQVIAEAERLGIDATTDVHDIAFRSGGKILVTNIYKLFNGKSVFGVGPLGERIEIGALVIDDAHACLQSVIEQFRVRLPNTHPVYDWILKNFGPAMKRQSSYTHLSIVSGDPQYYQEIPFWNVQEQADALLKVMHDSRETEELKFTFPFIADVLPLSRIVISGREVEITPMCPPTDLVNSFRNAKRRIYMTATLSDDSILVTHFGAQADKLTGAITAASSQAMGERMIIMPQEINPDITLPDVKGMLAKVAKNYNVVVIVPSKKVADEWADVANQTLVGDAVSQGVAKLKEKHVGLTVLVNRYDGIDLPKEACRLLAIVDLPEAASLLDRVDTSILGSSAIGLRRQIQRIEQGMGRGVRSTDDHCAVVLFGAKLTERLLSKDGREMLTPATQAQLALSRQLAKQIGGATIGDIEVVIKKCLERDKGWIAASKKALLKAVKQPGLNLDSGQIALKRAFDEARYNEHTKAAATLADVANGTDDEPYKAWLKVRTAEMTNFFDRAEAQRILQSAYRLNRNAMRPVEGVSYEKLKAQKGAQAIAVQAFFRDRFLETPERILFAQSLSDALVFEPDAADKFEQAVLDLGLAIGITSQRPEKQLGEGPDNLWRFRDGRFLVVECKNGSTSTNGISKTELGQLEQADTWFNERYGNEERIPVIIHPLNYLGPQASAPKGLRVISKSKLEALRHALVSFVKAISIDSVLSNEMRIKEALETHKLSESLFLGAFSVGPK
ncbi:DEAD/DEAH box helicase family protein [Rhodopseudomonas sp. BR0M22]|uniref:DEAD/DEAH box helicase family protein n=1 Tax=Rhodopseudomonas sp. BR0M22 TaxID=2269369 RepID=UPI0032E4BE4F